MDFFREGFYSSLTLTELRSRMQIIVDACGCHASKQSDSRDRGLISSLPIPYCANSLLYLDFIHGLPRFGGYDSCCNGMVHFRTLIVHFRTCLSVCCARVCCCARKGPGSSAGNCAAKE